MRLIRANETCSDFWSCVLNFTHSISSRSLQTWGSVAQTAILEPQLLHLWLQASLHWHWKQSKIWVILWKKKKKIKHTERSFSLIQNLYPRISKCFGNLVVSHSTFPRAGKICVLISSAKKLTPWNDDRVLSVEITWNGVEHRYFPINDVQHPQNFTVPSQCCLDLL